MEIPPTERLKIHKSYDSTYTRLVTFPSRKISGSYGLAFLDKILTKREACTPMLIEANGAYTEQIGIDPELMQIHRSLVCHCEAFEEGRGNLKLSEPRINHAVTVKLARERRLVSRQLLSESAEGRQRACHLCRRLPYCPGRRSQWLCW